MPKIQGCPMWPIPIWFSAISSCLIDSKNGQKCLNQTDNGEVLRVLPCWFQWYLKIEDTIVKLHHSSSDFNMFGEEYILHKACIMSKLVQVRLARPSTQSTYYYLFMNWLKMAKNLSPGTIIPHPFTNKSTNPFNMVLDPTFGVDLSVIGVLVVVMVTHFLVIQCLALAAELRPICNNMICQFDWQYDWRFQSIFP